MGVKCSSSFVKSIDWHFVHGETKLINRGLKGDLLCDGSTSYVKMKYYNLHLIDWISQAATKPLSFFRSFIILISWFSCVSIFIVRFWMHTKAIYFFAFQSNWILMRVACVSLLKRTHAICWLLHCRFSNRYACLFQY